MTATAEQNIVTGKEFTINRCKVIINLATESNGKTIETVKSILLSTYYQDISQRPDKKAANG